MKESDWKLFVNIKELALEAYCVRALAEMQSLITDQDQDAHTRFVALYQLLQARNKQLAFIFEGHSRSKAALQLRILRFEKLADESLLGQLSPEFLQQTDPQA